MSRAEERLLSLGIRLPDLPGPKGSYLLFRRAGDLVFVSGQSAFTADGAPLFPGRVGAEVTLEQGRRAAHLLGGRAEEAIPCDFPGRSWEHRLLPIRKMEKTARQYPRKAGTPSKSPLGAGGK